ncbi:SH2 domain-containing adapter protein D isoform X2 [Pezoporus flaviventris]|uniref:SH2 domain-containing adapter protein D isoform X2 n=1 Tax=Pezoporus flaviventris TaxID=889875 RepID=UPI002AB320BE|nr:SH2 domain-containing adapter protein D isoform X2 [Pezoporus flaviventris]
MAAGGGGGGAGEGPGDKGSGREAAGKGPGTAGSGLGEPAGPRGGAGMGEGVVGPVPPRAPRRAPARASTRSRARGSRSRRPRAAARSPRRPQGAGGGGRGGARSSTTPPVRSGRRPGTAPARAAAARAARAARAACPGTTSARRMSTTSPGSGSRITSPGRSQFESPERSPSLSRQLQRPPRPPPDTGCPPSPRHVDASLPLEKQVWYHGPIGRAGAETLLALCREGSFLVRDCETSPEDYSLSLRSSHGFVHVKLTRTREHHFTLGRAGAAFPSVPAAVRHYTARALPVRGARHLSLLYPVAAQPL